MMKTMKIQFKYLCVAALALLGAMMSSCTNDELATDVAPLPVNNKSVTLTTTVSLDDATRALAIDEENKKGVKTFETNDKVALIYIKSDGTKKVAESVLTSENISADGKSANLTFQLEEPKEGDSNVTLVYPVWMADKDAADGINMTALQVEQNGTLYKLSWAFDTATAAGQMTVSGDAATLPAAVTMTNPLTIAMFTLKEDYADITSTVTQFTVNDGTHKYVVNREPADGPIYVAMRPIAAAQTISLTAVTDAKPYKKSVTGKALAASRIYPVNVMMTVDADRTTPLTLEAKEAGAKVTFTFSEDKAEGDVEYSTDGTKWSTYTDGTAITLNIAGDKVMFRGNCQTYDQSNISCDKDCYVYGNVMSLISPTDFATVTELTASDTFTDLFKGNEHIVNHNSKPLSLPATELTNNCYANMFEGCTSLETAPVLPATKLYDYCYQSMFQDCSSLETAPALPATELTRNCYASMFQGCRSLETAPALPATKLASYCYASMFQNCNNLTSVTCLATDITAKHCLLYWLEDAGSIVSGENTLHVRSGQSTNKSYWNVPDDWTVVADQ